MIQILWFGSFGIGFNPHWDVAALTPGRTGDWQVKFLPHFDFSWLFINKCRMKQLQSCNCFAVFAEILSE